MMLKKKIIILGATGSIGKSTINVILKQKKNFQFILLAASKNYSLIISQIKILKPKYYIVSDKKIYKKIRKKIKNKKTKILNNFNILDKMNIVDFTISAIPGIAGLEPTIKSASKSKTLLIANKESIISGWDLIKKYSKKYQTKIQSIDSEHFSINKIIKNINNKKDIKKIYLTASGGPFLNYKKNELKKIKPRDALKHPNWKMGKKISVDSSNLMNKVFEVIEASKIFGIKLEKFKIVIHPQSLVHAIVELRNGLLFFVYHEPDMRIPIANSILNKNFDIKKLKIKKLNKETKLKTLNFFAPSLSRFPSLKILNFIKKYPFSDILINSANEELVRLFLQEKIDYNSIIGNILNLIKDKKFKKYAIHPTTKLSEIYFLDQLVKNYLKNKIKI